MNIKRMRLTREEKAIEAALLRGEYRPVSPEEFKMIVDAIKRRKKDAILSIRLNAGDLDIIKKKAKRADVPYQTLISEVLHNFAMSPRA